MTALRANLAIAFAESDSPALSFDVTPNDYWWPNEWAQVTVGAPRAWSLSTGSPSTTVAILDTGVDPTQPDLQGSFVPGWNTLSNSSDTADTNGHGTDVAGVAVARGNNGIGISAPRCNFATGLNGWYATFCGTSSAAPALAASPRSRSPARPRRRRRRSSARSN